MPKGKKIAIRYQSRNGNTRAVAETIANAAGVKAEPIHVPLNETVDLLFIGGGVYAWDMDHSLKEFLASLQPDKVKAIAVFSTTGGMNVVPKIAAAVKAKGIPVIEKTLLLRFGIRNHKLLGGKGYIKLSDKELKQIKDFTLNAVQ